MKMAFLSDLHGNLPALEAALVEVKRQSVRRIAVAGDLVGHGPHPREVLRRLRRGGLPCIRGNVDNKVLDLVRGRDDLAAALEKKRTGAASWAALRLSKTDLAWLARLPAELEWSVGGCRILVTHGSPLGDTDYVFASITARALRTKLQDRQVDVLICGHSHVAFVKRIGGVLVVNCGAVGRSVDGDPRGAFALLEIGRNGRARARIIRFPYDVEAVAAAIETRGAPFVEADEYRRGLRFKR